jgi:hypothetical protein
MSNKPEQDGAIRMRILLAFEKQHTTHMDSVRTAIQRNGTDAEVMVVEPRALEEETQRFNPHLVVCEAAIPQSPDGKVPSRIDLSIEPSQPSRFRVGQRRWELLNPGLEQLTAVVVETERLISRSS